MQAESILAFRSIIALLFVSLLLLTSIHPAVSAQELAKMYVVGMAELQKNSFVSVINKNKNGEVCAVVTIVTDLKGDIAFEAGAGIVKVDFKPGESSLFLSPGERIITVRMSGFEPLRIILREHGIPRLKSGRVWQLKVSGKNIPPDTGKGDFTLATDPPGAEIRIEGSPDFKGVTPFDFKSYSARPYRVHLSKNRYAAADTFMVIEKDGKSSLSVALRPLRGLLSVTSNEQNTTFIVTDLETNDVVYNARGNPNREVLIGKYRINAEAPEYEVISREVVIQEGATQSVRITFTENQRREFIEARENERMNFATSIYGVSKNRIFNSILGQPKIVVYYLGGYPTIYFSGLLNLSLLSNDITHNYHAFYFGCGVFEGIYLNSYSVTFSLCSINTGFIKTSYNLKNRIIVDFDIGIRIQKLIKDNYYNDKLIVLRNKEYDEETAVGVPIVISINFERIFMKNRFFLINTGCMVGDDFLTESHHYRWYYKDEDMVIKDANLPKIYSRITPFFGVGVRF